MPKKIVLISTGGTIAMRFDETKNGMVPALTGQELIEAVPPLKDVGNLEVIEYANIPSAHLTLNNMLELAKLVEVQLNRDEVSGVIITHGTDTMEETAYFLDLYIQHDKPVCLTAAMRTSSEVSPDGPHNILCAARVAASPLTHGYGTMVVMNSEIHAAQNVTKTHAGNVKTFASPFWGPIGYVDSDRIIMQRKPIGHERIRPKQVTAYVPILKAYTGMEERWLKALLSEPIDGLILEGFGRGNFPPSIIEPIEALLKKQIPVVVTTRCLGGRTLDVYAAPAAGADLLKRGAILAGEINSQKARIKLVMALNTGKNLEMIRPIFQQS